MRDSNGFKLTAVKIARIKKPGRYGDGGGLYLKVDEYARDGKPALSKSWVFRFERDGRERMMGLGPLNTLSLAEARAKARQCRQALLDGLDPIAARQARRRGTKLEAARSITFKQVAKRYIDAHSATWKNPAHAAQWPSTMASYVYPVIGDLPVAAIDTALVMKVLEPIWREIPETGSRVRGRIERILDAAKASGYRDGENPARWRGHLQNLLPARAKLRPKVNMPAMPDTEMPAFMAELRKRGGTAARALEFTILCAGRTGEILGAQWSEIDFKDKLWTVPKERMKAGKAHTVPLSDRALAILKSADRVAGCPYVFPGAKDGKPLSNMSMLKLMRSMRPGYTVHGTARSTFSDWARDHTHHARDVIEFALAHGIEDKAEEAYRRRTAVEKRRLLMADWARFLAKPAGATKGGKVIALR
jgi:integrase